MDFRKVFDLIPEEFDKWRPRYTQEAFDDIIEYAGMGPGRKMLEMGPGTGQATEPFLKCGCDYTGIELGEHLYHFLQDKFAVYPNARFVNGDFCTYDFGDEKFDMILSAATIQWLPEDIAFKRCCDLLNPGGCLVMIATISDEKARNTSELLADKNAVYDKYFKPSIPYTCSINKMNVVNYGFETPEIKDFCYDADMTADEFVSLTMTNAPHILLAEPDRTAFMEGLRDAINAHGGEWRCRDRVNIVRARKPL